MLVPREQLIDANAKLMGSYATAQIAGPSIAGALVQPLPRRSRFSSTRLVPRLRGLPPLDPRARARTAIEAARPLRHDLALGLRYVRDHLQRAIAGSAATLNFFGAAIYAVLVLYAR